jgi:HK97 family phage prohead protease
MNEKLAKFLAAIQQRSFTGSGIGTAAGYVLTVVGAAEADGFCRQFPGKSAGDFRALLKAAADRFVYRPPVAEPLTAVTKAKRGEVVTFGAPVRKDADKMAAASIMEFENVLTTDQKDRDGDILHPKGCKVDPSAPLLWQHIPTEPIGKLVQVVEQTDKLVKTHCAIADTPLGQLAAKLVEFGALRISHGFKPTSWKAISEGDDQGGMVTGWEVEACEVMEVSLVSVPANTGAVITAYQKYQKDFDACPIAKAWAERLWSERPAAVVGGWGGNWQKGRRGAVVVNVNLPAPAADPKAAAPPAVKGDDGKPKGDADPKEEEKPKGDEKPDDKAGNLLADIAERAQGMADDETLSAEVRARCSVVAGILTDVGAAIGAAMETISTAAQNQDLAGLVAAQQELTANCGTRLQRAGAELQSLLAASDDLDEGAAGAVQEMAESVAASLSGIMPNGGNNPGEGDGTGDWVTLDEDESDDKDDTDDESEEEKDDAGDDESEAGGDDSDDESAGDKGDDDDDDDEREEKDDDDADSDDEEKAGDDEDGDEEEKAGDDDTDDDEREEKDGDEVDPDDENPGADGEPNPGVGKGKPKKPGKAADLNAAARELVAAAIEGGPVSLEKHRRFTAAVMAGGDIDPGTLLMYRQTCGAVLKKLAAK